MIHRIGSARLAGAALAATVALVLTGCGATTPAPAAPSPASEAPAATASSSAPAAAAPSGDLCSMIGFDRLNDIMTEGGEPLSSATPTADGGCALTGKTGAFVVARTDDSAEHVVDGRKAQDVSAGAKALWVESARLFVLQHGDGAITVTVGGSDPVDLSTVMSVAYSVDALLP